MNFGIAKPLGSQKTVGVERATGEIGRGRDSCRGGHRMDGRTLSKWPDEQEERIKQSLR